MFLKNAVSFFGKLFGKNQDHKQRILVIGGSGRVGSLILPYLSEENELTILDLEAPPKGPWKYIRDNALDRRNLTKACKNQEALIYLAVGKPHDNIEAAHDVNVKGLHLALESAWQAEILRAIYASTLSVYEDLHAFTEGQANNENNAPRPKRVYGLTKALGEETCRFFSRKKGMTIFALRLFLPVSRKEWHEKKDGLNVDCRTSAPDVARAFMAALKTDHEGFEIFHISGDYTGKVFSHEKAKRILNWGPMERPSYDSASR